MDKLGKNVEIKVAIHQFISIHIRICSSPSYFGGFSKKMYSRTAAKT
jgi:hypothetical protein